VYAGSVDHNVYALNAGTGALLWSFGAGPTASVYSPPTVANGVVWVGSFDSEATVYALNAGTGALLWSYATDNNVGSAPAVVNGVVYLGSYDYKVYATERPHWGQAVKLRHRQAGAILTCRGEWHGLRRLGRRKNLRLRREVSVIGSRQTASKRTSRISGETISGVRSSGGSSRNESASLF
jgi:hypothetical protein